MHETESEPDDSFPSLTQPDTESNLSQPFTVPPPIKYVSIQPWVSIKKPEMIELPRSDPPPAHLTSDIEFEVESEGEIDEGQFNLAVFEPPQRVDCVTESET